MIKFGKIDRISKQNECKGIKRPNDCERMWELFCVDHLIAVEELLGREDHRQYNDTLVFLFLR